MMTIEKKLRTKNRYLSSDRKGKHLSPPPLPFPSPPLPPPGEPRRPAARDAPPPPPTPAWCDPLLPRQSRGSGALWRVHPRSGGCLWCRTPTGCRGWCCHTQPWRRCALGQHALGDELAEHLAARPIWTYRGSAFYSALEIQNSLYLAAAYWRFCTLYIWSLTKLLRIRLKSPFSYIYRMYN